MINVNVNGLQVVDVFKPHNRLWDMAQVAFTNTGISGSDGTKVVRRLDFLVGC
jgi:hypothetical protein